MRTRTAFEEDEDEIGHHEDDREVTLSSTTVLLIFFGLVLVCGLCFGLGYSLGHRSTPEGAEAAPITQAPLVASSASGQAKPSAASVTPAPVSDTPATSVSDTGGSTAPAEEVAKPVVRETAPASQPAIKPATATPSQPQVKPALSTSTASQTAQTTQLPSARATVTPAAMPTTPAPAAPGASNPAAVPAGSIMVQIAAISNPQDAQVLVSALRKRGYSASVHNQASDSLLHVQVGPFATRAEAAAMKQKLLSDGYNAILK